MPPELRVPTLAPTAVAPAGSLQLSGPASTRAPELDAGKLVQIFDGSSVSGVVSIPAADAQAIEQKPVTPEQAEGKLPPHAREDLSAWETFLIDHGVAAYRNRSPDLIGQLRLSSQRPIDTVICSALDADPTLPLSGALVATYGIELVRGVRLVQSICGAGRAWIACDARLPGTWVAAVRSPLKKGACKLVFVANDYPLGDPTLLLYSLLNRRLRPGHLPAEQGVLVLDAATAIAIGRAAIIGEKMLAVPLAVRDHRTQQTHFVIAPIGIALGQILRQLGIVSDNAILRGGDLLRDQRISTDAVASASELTVHISSLEPAINPDPCIRCGWCVEACPTRVHPAATLEAAQRDDIPLADRAGVEACIECGICSYVCPSKLPLLQAARLMREKWLESRRN
jgi:electron transport complex protein RnfC